MIPLYDENPSYHKPYVTWGLIAANVLVFLYQLSLSDTGLERFVFEFALVPKEFFADVSAVRAGHPVPPSDFYPLFTNMFMHGGWLHLGGNMLYLYIFGDNVEDRLGHWRFLLFYLLAGVIASLAHAWSSPMSTLPSLGASGAIGGVLGAYIVLYPKARVTSLAILGFFITRVRIPAFVYLGIWFALQALSGLTTLGVASAQSEGGTAWWAHIGGFVTGVVVGALARLTPEPRNPYADRWYSNR